MKYYAIIKMNDIKLIYYNMVYHKYNSKKIKL